MVKMILTKKQEEGLKIAIERYRHGEKYTCIAGYAGTGKSTLVKFIVSALNVPEEEICYATFTGKAAQVLLKKGNKNVSTLHKLLYKSIPKADGGFIRIPVDDVPYRIVIVDEVSMAPKTLMKLLFNYRVHVICLGDPFQLPTIDKDEDNGLLERPHIFLDEVMRQAAESEIIRLTMDIRAGKTISYSPNGKEALVLDKSQLNTGMLQWADQILVGTNAKRREINALMRTGRSASLEVGDKIICGRNCWDIVDNLGENALVNGTIGFVTDVTKIEQRYPDPTLPRVPLYLTGFTSSFGGTYSTVPIDQNTILKGEKTLTPQQEAKFYRNKRLSLFPMPIEFDYGYAITCHRAQGSQWNNVFVCEENFPNDRNDHKRWLYTAVTRAAQKLILMQRI
jgi:exodeoxyribonuclease-5